ncbi:MAG: dephospho-CoA kinase [Methylotenera sp.]|nr:dephospho-CoA kinase [Methylotenera sp.]MDO9232006.1 dephospho-CoA kinase [Methylotenera sp.]MDO9389293.1 dephospho-CoA kinase [Methylotenera sp.]MDP2101463.1 dephospho-CoA kinase [Methylotenera sp.]MDP2280427.1 dephospho-CoA kinase [Methylotenera sp.]
MIVIALTGGIGSGKSEAAKQFKKLGVPVVDTDAIAHALTVAGEPLLTEIGRIFGMEFLNADGTLNRAKLRAHILSDAKERLKLEALLHPAIHARAVKQLTANQNQLHPLYQVLVVPLFFENNRYQAITHKILAIDCDEALQIERAMARSGLSEPEVKAMMAAQVCRETRRKLSDEVIENNGSVEDLAKKINELHKKLINTCIVNK